MENLYLITLFSALISFLITPLVRKLAFSFNVVDVPKDNRRVHKKPIPKLGGLAIYIAFLIMIFLKKSPIDQSEIGIIIGSLIIVIGGVVDDKYNIKPWQKLLFQIAAASFLIFFKVMISVITNPISDVNLYIRIANFIAVPLTMLWVIGVTNAFNLIDGLDGLSAGLAFIACITMTIVAFLSGKADMEVITLTIILGGAILGFLPHNFNPASIFMGDTGAQLLGFLLASIAMRGAIKSASAIVLAVPILALGLPIYDTIFAIIRRKVNGKSIAEADRGHLHHRLLDMGLTQRQAVIIMYLISIALGFIAVIVMQLTNKSAYTVLGVVIIVIVLLAWKFGLFRHRS
ncbi:putative undecaprenyl-phosphate N-acetylglucosaminyl 1-phosphate transferase [Clostridium pasteurianum DSM 525 = ATCC 6013]|uniref:Glycosyl transferase family 4 n=1 Tax=Clostridium pasteurianum DSM 525 = ATCC 6013 TaxID=1262449 RepID=A0A0H3J857_CLOPA|nr:MraY family glycosyltransferase [Clostridium pasteurianum]AJA49629.1 putative undecaprenyl-phosphate N-acetylglucosaminyl 1-phosphate transferase [Clostridium pasteurianum DSM 525 = ATCC 6013]AJA53617.1 putative undecaprenyl-phosphate N-acetylglucosaminyl 1-phosphate transferase [Clostridium pasteurianum DSM 525 = ATCC 6013]AOZ76782.1 glycosyl transferase [Clostridium pasteurianum DSM 525 = ATCC 6013]AOZ80579.1 glycosyl transferase [Clostridium pasteurianum]ELP58855.1 UDP-phosphate N-acetyl